MKQVTVRCAGTVHTPLRSRPLRIARCLSSVGTTWDDRRRGRGRLHGQAGRLLDREVERDRDQVAVGARGVRRLEPLVELLEVDAPVTGSLAEHLGHLVPVGVRDSQA